MKCDSCKHWDKGLDEYPCSKCIHNAIEHYEPITNFERIKAMSVINWQSLFVVSMIRKKTMPSSSMVQSFPLTPNMTLKNGSKAR